MNTNTKLKWVKRKTEEERNKVDRNRKGISCVASLIIGWKISLDFH